MVILPQGCRTLQPCGAFMGLGGLPFGKLPRAVRFGLSAIETLPPWAVDGLIGLRVGRRWLTVVSVHSLFRFVSSKQHLISLAATPHTSPSLDDSLGTRMSALRESVYLASQQLTWILP